MLPSRETVTMPKIAIHEYSDLLIRKNDVGPTRKSCGVLSKAETPTMKDRPHSYLYPGVLALNS